MKDSPYDLRLKNPSPYSIFQSRIVFTAYKKVLETIAESNHIDQKQLGNQSMSIIRTVGY